MISWRRLSAWYLVALFVSAAAAPHHHLDPIADLLSDRPSNSGTFTQVGGTGSPGVGLYAGAIVQDESCFACFHSDFAASPAVAIALTVFLQPLPDRPETPTAFTRSADVSDTPSRAPPVLA